MEKLRIDKYLWAIRLFKTRTAATKACEAGHVKLKDEKVKASAKVGLDDELFVRVNNINRHIIVKKLIEKRVGAPIAQEYYEDLTPAEELNKFKLPSAFFVHQGARDRGTGRPTKKDRRDIDKFKEN